MTKLTKDYIKASSFSTSVLADLINYWEEDRGACESEYLYDLQRKEDFKEIVDMYSVSGAVSAFNIHDRFWWGGCNFPYNDDAMCKFLSDGGFAESIHEIVFKPFVGDEKTWEWILGEIELRITDYLAGGMDIPTIEMYYGNMIDVKGFVEDNDKTSRAGVLKGVNVDGHVLNTIIPINNSEFLFNFKTETGDEYKAFYVSEDDTIPSSIYKICPFTFD